MRLHLSEALDLPLEFLTETTGVLAKKGAGKTSTASVIAEEAIPAGIPCIIIDPTGAWHGLRSSADGNSVGLPVTIFGGDHADVPILATHGAAVAQFIVDRRISAVLDLSLLRKGEQVRFVTDFSERLFHINREPVCLIIDEADLYAPQRPFPEVARCLGAIEDLVRRGRKNGIGTILITQRPAVLNKNVLEQVDNLIVLQMTGPNDRKAIDGWVDQHADPALLKEVSSSLPSMKKGEAWVWMPASIGLRRVQIRRRRTFDSGATPKIGQKVAEPKVVAQIDLEQLRTQLAEQIAEAEEGDPKTLRARIADLQRQLREHQESTPTVEYQIVEKPILDLHAQAVLDDTIAALERVGGLIASLKASVEMAAQKADLAHKPALNPAPLAKQALVREREMRPASHTSTSPVALPKAERSILTVLAQHGTSAKSKLAILAGYAHNGGGFNNALGALRSKGYITREEPICITDDGHAALGPYESLPSGQALHEFWLSKLNKAEAAALSVLIQSYPKAMPKERVASWAGYASNGGGFNNALGRLRTLQLIEGYGEMKASDALFEGGR